MKFVLDEPYYDQYNFNENFEVENYNQYQPYYDKKYCDCNKTADPTYVLHDSKKKQIAFVLFYLIYCKFVQIN